jgi:hypothetical protein
VGSTSANDTFCLSLKPVLEKQSRITQFRIGVTSGRIKFMKDIPSGWDISINNAPSWNSTIQANIIVGAAALSPDKFNNLICIESIKLPDLEFKLEGEIATTHDFEKEKITKIKNNDFVLKRQKKK